MSYLKKYFYEILLAAIIIIASCSKNPVKSEEGLFHTITPAEAGFSASALQEVEDYAVSMNYAAVMAVYDGDVFFSWGNTSYDYWCHSIRKPLLNSIFGIHVENGNIDITNTLEDLGIDDSPTSLTEAEKQATVQDLLKSQSGVYIEAASETQEARDMRPERGSHQPGTFFYYNNWDFNTLGTIFMQETGTDIFEEFKDKIANPIGMQDFSIDRCTYQYETNYSMHPSYKFRMSARDLARFGVLFQQNGNWDGEQIIPTDWIEESTTVAYGIENPDFGLGYGYLWGIIPEVSPAAEQVGYTGFFHSGYGGHLLLIIPELKLVIVERYNTDGNWNYPDEDAMMGIAMRIISARN